MKILHKPFLKWAGNKHRLLFRILPLLPSAQRLIEPFAGAAAVFLNSHYNTNIIADNNPDLINLYHHLQHDKEHFIRYSQSFFQDKYNQEAQYYDLRERFNKTRSQHLKAALFLYLNRHGYNGLCRYNHRGKFNVPFGHYKQPYFPTKEMQYFYQKAYNTQFLHQDFTTTLKDAQKGDVIYADPPYLPLNHNTTFTQYSKQGFSLLQQQQLAQLAEQLAQKGIPVLISNHYTPLSKELYRHAALQHFRVQRFISCKGAQRTKASEVLALFTPY